MKIPKEKIFYKPGCMFPPETFLPSLTLTEWAVEELGRQAEKIEIRFKSLLRKVYKYDLSKRA